MNDTPSRRYTFAMWEGGGTIPPMLGVAKRLIARGHRVRVLGDPTIRAEAEQIGCRFTPWRQAPHRTDLRPENDLLKDWETKNPLAMIRRFRDAFIVDPAARYASDTLDALEADPPDQFVPDYVLFGAIMAAQKLGIPVTPLVPNIWPMPVRGAPAFGPGFPLANSALGRMRDRLFFALSNRLFNGAVPRLNATRKSLGLAPLDNFYDQVLGSGPVLVLSSARFDFSAPFVPQNVRYVGPILDDPQWAEPWTPPWPEANRDPLVLVAFSSTFQDQAALLRRIVGALADLPVRALVTLGEMLDPEQVPSKGAAVVVRSAPHQQVLPMASLVITHCGHGTTLKTLAAGVPMVCIPMGRDQNDNAARVVHRGAGLRLSPKASQREIASAAQRVLSDDQYRAAAQALGREIEEERAGIDIAAELERA